MVTGSGQRPLQSYCETSKTCVRSHVRISLLSYVASGSLLSTSFSLSIRSFIYDLLSNMELKFHRQINAMSTPDSACNLNI
jgi:hypothetical protein